MTEPSDLEKLEAAQDGLEWTLAFLNKTPLSGIEETQKFMKSVQFVYTLHSQICSQIKDLKGITSEETTGPKTLPTAN